MALWMIERDVTGWSTDDLDAAAIRSKQCLVWFPEMTWVRSYLDRAAALTICIYDAANEEDIRGHARLASLPCSRISLVEEIDPALVEDPPAATQAGALET